MQSGDTARTADISRARQHGRSPAKKLLANIRRWRSSTSPCSVPAVATASTFARQFPTQWSKRRSELTLRETTSGEARRHPGLQHKVCAPVGVSAPFCVAEAVHVGLTGVELKPAGGEYDVPVHVFMPALMVTSESVHT